MDVDGGRHLLQTVTNCYRLLQTVTDVSLLQEIPNFLEKAGEG